MRKPYASPVVRATAQLQQLSALFLCCFALLTGAAKAQPSLIWNKDLPLNGNRFFFNDPGGNMYGVYDVIKIGAPNNLAARIYKFTPGGDTAWSVTTEMIILATRADAQGNIYLGGKKATGFASKAAVMKINAAGVVEWDNLYLDAEFSTDRITMMKNVPDGSGVYFIAYDYALNGWNATSKSHLMSVGKILADGTLAWSSTYTGPDNTNRRASSDNQFIEVGSDDNLRVACSIDLSDVSSIEINAVYCASFSPAGTKLWESINGTKEARRRTQSAVLDKNNNIVFCTDSATGFFMSPRLTVISGADGSRLNEIVYPGITTVVGEIVFRNSDQLYLLGAKPDRKTYAVLELDDQWEAAEKSSYTCPVPTAIYNGYGPVIKQGGYTYINFILHDTGGNSFFKQCHLVKLNAGMQKTWDLSYTYGGGVSKGIIAVNDTSTLYLAKDSGNQFTQVQKHNTTLQNNNPTTGLSSFNDHSLQVHVYPNPATSVLHIGVNGKARISLYTLNGALQLTATGNQVDVSQLEKGFYILHVTGIEGTSVKKILIQ